MNKQEAQRRTHMAAALTHLGVSTEAQAALRRISLTLHRWHELECGTEDQAVERDETTGRTYAVNTRTGRRYPTPDRETGALKRLAVLAAQFPALILYVQGDPRGAALYVVRRSDVPEGGNVAAYYSRGVAVY